jgi:hypothetical protein
MTSEMNLNKVVVDDENAGQALKDHRAVSVDGQTIALFKGLEEELVLRIRAADVVVGCVAYERTDSARTREEEWRCNHRSERRFLAP